MMTVTFDLWEVAKACGEALIFLGIGLFIGLWLMNPFR
jgi:hypothetical protein